MYPDLKNKIAIVTGASRGIGSAIAKRLGREGVKVIVNYSRSESEAAEVVREIEKGGGAAAKVQADVTKVAEVVRMFDDAEKIYGQADIVVNNACAILYKLVADVTEKEFDDLFAVNLKGTFFSSQLAARRLKNGGSIVNLSSSTTMMMLPTYGVYVAIKGAVEQFSRVLSKELGARKIRVNVISPGPTETKLFVAGKSQADLAEAAGRSAFGRLGQPMDIANVVAFLVSDQGAWITGQNIRANGGAV